MCCGRLGSRTAAHAPAVTGEVLADHTGTAQSALLMIHEMDAPDESPRAAVSFVREAFELDSSAPVGVAGGAEAAADRRLSYDAFRAAALRDARIVRLFDLHCESCEPAAAAGAPLAAAACAAAQAHHRRPPPFPPPSVPTP